MDSQDSQNRLPRRRVLQIFAAITAAEGLGVAATFAQARKPAPTGYGQDPKLNHSYERGEVWPLTFTDAEKKAAVALADVIFPKDDLGPAASEVRVADFIDEWVSAPYPSQKSNRKVIIPGLKQLDERSRAQFRKSFADLTSKEKEALCNELAKGDNFFNTFTSLAAGAYYSDPRCWPALGYQGNIPIGGACPGPPEAVLKQAGVEQTVAIE